MNALPEFRVLSLGNHRLPCPYCPESSKKKSLGVTIDATGGVYHCFRCEAAGGWRANRAYTSRTATPLRTTHPKQHLALASHWLAFWRGLKPIADTPVSNYLRARGCALPPHDADIRYGELRHPSGYTGPCMVALVTDAVTHEPLTLHRTWINADGTKADVDPPRLLLGKHRKAGGVIRLWPDEAITTAIGIAEGIETALAVATVFQPVWSCIDAGNLAAFPVLDGIESLLIVADHDDAGIRAANECAERWHRAGREVRIAIPPPGMDAADLARAA